MQKIHDIPLEKLQAMRNHIAYVYGEEKKACPQHKPPPPPVLMYVYVPFPSIVSRNAARTQPYASEFCKKKHLEIETDQEKESIRVGIKENKSMEKLKDD